MLASALALSWTPAVVAQSAGSLTLDIALEGRNPGTGELHLAVVLGNAGSLAVALPARPDWDVEGGLELLVTRVNGPTFTVPALARDPMRETLRASGEDTTELEAGHATVYSRTIHPGALELAPGQYRIVVSYRPGGVIMATSEPIMLNIE